MVKISVILPTYEPGHYIYECLHSLLCQKLDPNYFEVLIVLNGPKYPYYSEIENFIILNGQKHNIFIRHSHEKGVSNARNYGLKKSIGDYIVFIDDDDIVSENYLYSLLRSAYNDKIVLSNVLTFEENIHAVETDYLSSCYVRNNNIAPNLWNSRSFFSVVWGKIIPKEVIGNKQFDSRFSIGEDALFMASISSKVKTIQYESPDTVYYRRQRQGSASRSKISKFSVLSKNIQLIFEYLKLLKFRYNKHYPFFILSRIIATLLQIKKRVI